MQVRNTANGIVQLSYGDDGLDPLVMEGEDKGRPLNFVRFMDVVRATHPRPHGEVALMPDEMRAMAAKEMTAMGVPQFSNIPHSTHICVCRQARYLRR